MGEKETRSLEDDLSDYSRELLGIKTRLYLLQAIDTNIQRYVDPKSGQVMIQNLQVYEGVRDQFYMLVIDLCSFCTHFGEDGGFIRRLNNHLSTMRPKNPKKIDVREPMIIRSPSSPMSPECNAEIIRSSKAYRQKQLGDATKDALEAMFPGWAQASKVTQEDVEALRKRFLEAVRNVDKDRNVHRAHRFEKDKKKKAKALTPLTLEEIEAAFSVVEDLLGNLWMVSNLASFNFDTDLNPGTEVTARDLVDIMIYGSIGEVVRAAGVEDALKSRGSERHYYWQYREALKEAPLAVRPVD